MNKVVFRTADGRVVTFTAGKGKGRRKNPSDSPRYRSRRSVASRVDALDAARSAALKAAHPKRRVKKVTKRVAKKSVSHRVRCAPRSSRTVEFSDGRVVTFKRAAGCNKAAKRRRGKKLAERNLSPYTFVKGAALKGAAIKGKKKGDVFTSGGKAYRVVSYQHPKSGKRVRFALRVKKSAK